MFISYLNNEQQGQLLSLAEMIMNADGNIAEEEISIINTMKAQCSPDVLTAGKVSISDLATRFSTQPAKVSLLLELIGVAYADDDYHETEKKLIQEIASSLNISFPLLADMESWVKRQFLSMKEVNTFMEV